MSANGNPHPQGDKWGKVLSDQELERMYRAASGGGGTMNKGCGLFLLAALVFDVLAVYGAVRAFA